MSQELWGQMQGHDKNSLVYEAAALQAEIIALKGFPEGVSDGEVIEKSIELLILQALALDVHGRFQAAQRRLTNYERAQELGISLDVHQQAVPQLLTAADYKSAIFAMLRVTRQQRSHLELAYVCPDPPEDFAMQRLNEFKDEKFQDKYHHDLAFIVPHEAIILQAESWQYIRRDMLVRPVAGEDDPSVDMAAYFAWKNIYMSGEYLTRTKERLRWALQNFPKRGQELEWCCQFWGSPQ